MCGAFAESSPVPVGESTQRAGLSRLACSRRWAERRRRARVVNAALRARGRLAGPRFPWDRGRRLPAAIRCSRGGRTPRGAVGRRGEPRCGREPQRLSAVKPAHAREHDLSASLCIVHGKQTRSRPSSHEVHGGAQIALARRRRTLRTRELEGDDLRTAARKLEDDLVLAWRHRSRDVAKSYASTRRALQQLRCAEARVFTGSSRRRRCSSRTRFGTAGSRRCRVPAN